MMSALVKEFIKTYFVMVTIFGPAATHKFLIEQLPDKPPKMMSLSKFSKQLTGPNR